jgi:hypothetical protein
MKLIKPYVNGSGNGNKMSDCMDCGKKTHTLIAQEYAVFAGTDMVFCRDCVEQNAIEEEDLLN